MTDYKELNTRLQALTGGVPHEIANLANASALLWESLEDINWAGFYRMEAGRLVLGPFQGKVACTHIAWGRGVCGTAAASDTVQRVEDVHAFAGHIACDSSSNSEIVIPLHKGGAVWGVLDIDSPSLARFSAEDEEGLVRFARILEEALASTR